MKKLLCIVALSCLCWLPGRASTHVMGPTNWYDVITTTVTYTYSAGTVSWSIVNSAPGYTGGGNYSVSINGVEAVNYNPGGPSGPYNSTQSGSHAASIGDSVVAISSLYFAWTITGDAYTVTFEIPANETDHNVFYMATQNGIVKGGKTQVPGASATTLEIGGLASPDNVILNEVTGGSVRVDGSGNVLGSDSTTVITPVNSGTPTTSPHTVTGTTPPVVTKGADSSAPAAAVPAPTPSGDPAAVTPIDTPNPTPSGSGGSTKEDTEKQTNQIVAGLNRVISGGTSNSKAVVDAVNAASTANATGQNGLITATNKNLNVLDKINQRLETAATAKGTADGVSNGKLDAINGSLGTINTTLTSTNTKLDAANGHLQKLADAADASGTKVTEDTATYVADAAARTAAVSGAVTAAQGAGSSIVSGLGDSGLYSSAGAVTAVSPIIGDNGYASTPHVIPSTGDGPVIAGAAAGGFDTNPFTSEALQHLVGTGSFSKFCQWIRSVIQWSVVVCFLVWVAGEVRANCFAMTTVNPIPLTGSADLVSRASVVGNSVGVPLGVGLFGVQVVAISTLILAAPVIIVAALSTAGEVSVLGTDAVSSVTAAKASPGNFVTNCMSYMYVILPVATLVTAFINRLLVRVASITQWVITVVVLRVLSV